MSSGSQNGNTIPGLQGMHIRDASDVTRQTRLRLQAVTNLSSSQTGYTGRNMYQSKGNVNSYNMLFQIQQGLRELNGGTAFQTLIPRNINLGNAFNWTATTTGSTFTTAPYTSNSVVVAGSSVTIFPPIPTRT
jgi:hypothetical protein